MCLFCCRKMIADIFGESGDEEEFTVSLDVASPFKDKSEISREQFPFHKLSSCRVSTRRTWRATARRSRRCRRRRSQTLTRASTAAAKSESADQQHDFKQALLFLLLSVCARVCVCSTSMMSDFDIMLARRKAMNSKKRRHRDGGTFISDADDVVNAMITKMNEAAEVRTLLSPRQNKSLTKL